MSHRRLKSDQLWHFFCPSLRLNYTQRQTINLPATRLRNPSTTPRAPASRCLQTRYSSTQSHHTSPQNAENTCTGEDLCADSEYAATNRFHLTHPLKKSLRIKIPNVPESLRHLSTEKLEDMLAKLPSDKNAKVITAMQILHVLIWVRKIKPETRHYKALIQSHRDPLHGRAKTVRKLLNEMEARGILIDSDILHLALHVISYHRYSNYARRDVLAKLEERRLPVTPDGWHHIVAGMIRENRFELALEQIENMERKDIEIKDWLHILLVSELCKINKFDLVLQLIDARMSKGREWTKDIWTHVLQAATAANHHKLTRFIWNRIVERDITPPTPELCSQVLKVAASKGNTKLALSVTQMVKHHNEAQLKPEDFASLVGAFSESGDLRGALELLCVLHEEDHSFNASTSKIIIAQYRAKKTPFREVRNILGELKSSGKKIPLLCARLVIKLCEEATTDDPFAVDDGIEFYKELYSLCGQKPDASIFNALINMSRKGKQPEAAAFFVQEMQKLNIAPDSRTMQLMITMFVELNQPEVVQLYLDEAHQKRFKLSGDSRTEIRKLFQKSTSEDIVKLKDHPAVADTRETLLQKGYNKARRQRKRREAAIARAREQEGFSKIRPTLTTPEDLREKDEKIKAAVAEIRASHSE
ncbi:pentatricopeptide repeat protein [Aspergillus undulatus]|uniref:pentatricopeptide repeat protein n=1 Tax=Aspergillus undulatus TaxID=1810928 RepID=UPI003CCC9E99